MDEQRAHRVVDALRARGLFAHVERAGVYQFGIRVRVAEDRVAIWDTDGTAGLEAQVMRNGVLVGFVPTIPGSEAFDEAQTVDAIAGTDYDAPPPPARPASARPPGGDGRRPTPSAAPAPSRWRRWLGGR